MSYYLLYNDKIGQYLKNPEAGFWSTTNRKEAEGMLKAAVDYIKACGFKFLDGKLRILEVDSTFDPTSDPVPTI